MRLYQILLAGFLALTASLAGSFVYAETEASETNVKTVTLGTSVWPPYIMSSKSSERGYAYDVVKKAFELKGYKVIIKVMPWHEARQLTIEGKIDGLFPEYEMKENLKYFIYSDPFMAGPLVLYERKDHPMIIPETNNQEDFFNKMKAYRFGVVKGYANVPAFDKNLDLIKKEVVDDMANLEQLYSGEVDLILIDRLNAQYILNHNLPKKYEESLQQVGPVLSETHFYIVFSKNILNVGELNKDFNDGLDILKAKKITYQIMQQYIFEFLDRNAVPKKLKHRQ